MKSYSSVASLVLLIALLLWFASIPWRQDFIGGLVNAAALAALIGGLADWFGVTALFGRPLGISWGADVISRNRERIFADVEELLAEKLFARDRLNTLLQEEIVPSQLILSYLASKTERAAFSNALFQIIVEFAKIMEPTKLALICGSILRQGVEKNSFDLFFRDCFSLASDRKSVERIASWMADELCQLMDTPWFQEKISELLNSAVIDYRSKRSGLHAVIDSLLLLIVNADPDVLGNKLAGLMVNGITRLRNPSDPWVDWLHARLNSLGVDSELYDHLRSSMVESLSPDEPSTKSISQGLTSLRLAILENSSGENPSFWLRRIVVRVVIYFAWKLKQSPQLQANLDNWFRTTVFQSSLDPMHAEIRSTVRNVLGKMSTPELLATIQQRAGSDLQMIRINGTLVGGLVGATLFLTVKLTKAIGGWYASIR